jgi:hypothetical protein
MAGEVRAQAAGSQETLRMPALIHQGFARDKARPGLGLARASVLDPRPRKIAVPLACN